MSPQPVRSQLPLDQVNREPTTGAFRGLGTTLNAVLNFVRMRRQWLHHEKVPQSGGLIVVANHNSYFDPLALGEYLIWSGRWPHFLGKAQLWSTPLVGWLARHCEQIPVHRGTAHASSSLVAAAAALERGHCVTVYPEGTLTSDPDLWPMTGRTGAARLALETGAPLVPVAQWGAHRVIPGPGIGLPRLFGKTVHAICGDPIDLADLVGELGGPREREAVQAASVRIMDAITDLLEQLRGESAPEDRWDARVGARVPRGPRRLD